MSTYRILGRYFSGEEFLVCVGVSPNECRKVFAEESVEDYDANDTRVGRGYLLQRWRGNDVYGGWAEVGSMFRFVEQTIRRSARERLLMR